MKITRTNNELQYVNEANDTASELAFVERMKQYRLQASGASIGIYNDKGQLILHINPFDNTVLISQAEGVDLASAFGAKRFVVGEAKKQLSEDNLKDAKAQLFARDRTFTMQSTGAAINYRIVDKNELVKMYSANKNKMYDDLASLFGRCANFTASKEEEYLSGGSKEDKYWALLHKSLNARKYCIFSYLAKFALTQACQAG